MGLEQDETHAGHEPVVQVKRDKNGRILFIRLSRHHVCVNAMENVEHAVGSKSNV